MKDEIKDLLEFLQKIEFHNVGVSIEYNDLKILLDYITNLQEKNQRLSKNLDFMIDKNDEKQKVIDEASGMIQFIAFNSERPLTMAELNKVYYILKGEDK